MRLIDADALIAFMRKGWRVFPSSKLQHTCDITDIENAPTVDAEPVRHGHWINHFDDLFPMESTVECSICGEKEWMMTIINHNYCPNCGAKMNEVTEDDI